MKNEITISTEEYKELVAKTIPNNNENEYFKIRFEELLLENFKIEGNKLDIKDNWKFADEIEVWLKCVDRQMYKRIYNTLYDEKIKKKNDKMRMDKARANKQIDDEATEEDEEN